MAISLVAGQTANAFNNPVSTLNVVLPNRPQPGNLVVLSVAPGVAGLLTSVIDSNGNVYDITSQSPAIFAGAARVYICYLADAPFNASATITATLTAATDVTIHAAEFTGQDNNNLINTEALHTNNGTTSTNINDPTITPTKDNCLLFFGCACDALSVNSPWTIVGSIVNGNIAEYLIQGKAASQAVSITQNSGIWIGNAVAFNAAPTPVVQPRYDPADDETGWFAEMTQISEWWGAGASLREWFDPDFVLTPSITTPKTLNATCTTTCLLLRQVGKLCNATATSSSSCLRQVGKRLNATATSTSSLLRQVGKLLNATATTTSSVTKSTAKPLSATVTTSSSLLKQVGKVLNGVATTSSAMTRSVGKLLNATATTSSSLTKAVGKILNATVTSSSNLIVARVFLQILNATVTTTSSMLRAAGKSLNATVTSNSSIVKAISRTLNALLTTFSSMSAIGPAGPASDGGPYRPVYRPRRR